MLWRPIVSSPDTGGVRRAPPSVGCSPRLTPVPTHWDRWCKLTRAFVERPQRARFKPLREGQLLRSAMNVAKWRDRAGRRMGSDYTAMGRSTSQSGGRRSFATTVTNDRHLGHSGLSSRPPRTAASVRSGHPGQSQCPGVYTKRLVVRRQTAFEPAGSDSLVQKRMADRERLRLSKPIRAPRPLSPLPDCRSPA